MYVRAVESFLSWNDDGIIMAKEQGIPMLLTEYNSASCGGDPTVAPTVRFFTKMMLFLITPTD